MSRQTQDPSRINTVRLRKHLPYRTAVGLTRPSTRHERKQGASLPPIFHQRDQRLCAGGRGWPRQARPWRWGWAVVRGPTANAI